MQNLMKIFRHIALVLTALLIASCAVDEMWDGVRDAEGEEVVMTFKPKFEDFESVTKAIGDGSKVDKLLVQVYAEGAESLEFSQEYNKGAWNNIKIPFFYGKTYNVYFWAYAKSQDAYEIAEGGLKNGVTVNYPENTDALGHDALEYLDAFYAVETINLSDDIADNTKPSLTRPFAQVNLVADKAELETAKATKVEFTIDAADAFVPGGEALSSQSRTFTFKDENFFKDNEEISEGKAYLGTTYLFVPSSGSLEAKVTLYDSMGNKLKGPSTVTIPLASNQRTNLVFTGVEPAWDDDAMDVPAASDGWIHIETPEQMAAFLLEGLAEGAKVHVCLDINMGGLPQKYHEAIAARTFTDLTLYGGALESGNPVGGGSHMISNFTAPAFLANAAGLTVSNLVLDNFKVEGNGHVGTLVNTLKGSSTFTNVTVSNSSATTSNGAAGGVVGYIERVAQTTRSEVLNVTFANCHVNGAAGVPVAAGSDAEGKFVGLLNGYDYGETLTFDAECAADVNTAVADYVSSYTSQNQSCFLTATESKYDQYLGSESNRRGTVNYGTQRIVPKWDGSTVVEPLVESNIKLIYSAYDLAKLQKSSHSAVTFKTEVDLGGYKFDPIKSITNLDGENNTIYNLKVDMVHDGTGAAFIQLATGTTTHKDITFIGADIKNVHNPNIPAPNYGNTNDGGAGNAYAGTLVSHSGGTYTVTNVHVKNGKVYAVCKMGGLVGYVGGNLNMSSCSVDQYLVENYEPGIPNYYTLPSGYMDIYLQQFQDNTITNGALAILGIHKIPEYGRVNMLQWWYTQGEAGGLIGFVKSPKAVIDGCSVTNTTINCTGQPDKPVVANVWDKNDFDTSNPYVSGKPIFARGNTDIAGRHVNQFIGDVVSARASENGTDYDVTISNYTVSGNKYGNTDASSTNAYNHDYASGKYCEVVGCAYYVGVDVGLGSITLKHVNDYAGKLTFYPVGGEATKVVLEEPSGSGNNPTWTGGSFTDMKYEQGRDKIGGPWYKPTYGPWYYKTLSVYPTYP